MEQITDKNYLHLKADEKIVNVQIASPTEAFNRINFSPINEVLNFPELFEEMEPKEDDTLEVQKAKENFKMLFNTSLKSFGISDFTDDLENDNPLKKLLPQLPKNGTLQDLIQGMLNSFSDLIEDPSVWRELRNFSIQSLDIQKFDIDTNDKNFNNTLKDTPLQKSFLEFVEETFKYNTSLEKQRQFNFFINAYNSLNLLGLDKEKNKKVVFSSFQDDAQHTYYAAHCDYLVSDDNQLLVKAKILYELFNISTKVLSFNEFETLINQNNKTDYNFKLFAKDLAGVFDNGELEDDFSLEKQNKRILVYKLNNKIFGFFNYVNLVIEKEDTPFYIFYNKPMNYSRFTSFIEFSKITNKIVHILGPDSYKKEQFTEEDKKAIIKGNWQGRVWQFENEKFCLEIEQNEKKLAFYYIPNFKILR